MADLPRTSLAFNALMEAIAVRGGLCVVLGEYNCTQQEGAVASALASGAVRAADDASLEPQAYTNPVNTRRIDYALTHPPWWPIR